MSKDMVCQFTGKEMDKIYSFFDSVDMKCGDDEWYPSIEELSSTVIKMFYELSAELKEHGLHSGRKEKIKETQKKIMVFLMWIEDTQQGDLGFDTIDYLRKFIQSHSEILEDKTNE